MKDSTKIEPQNQGNQESDEAKGFEGNFLSPPAFALTAQPLPPPYEGNPDPIIPIEELISYLQVVEASFPKDSREQILTRVRQRYYGSLAFSRLIPASPEIENQPPLPFEMIGSQMNGGPEKGSKPIGNQKHYNDAYRRLLSHGDENGIADNPSPYVLLKNGEKIDLGHLLLGLDALAHPTTSAPYSTYDVPNIDPSSWVADLGIAAIWMEEHEVNGFAPKDAPVQLPAPDLDAYYKMSAPEADLLGDVDSFGTAQTAYENPDLPLSAVLEKYYLGKADSSPDVSSRWRTFCSMNGLVYSLQSGTIQWDSEAISRWVVRINRFNDLFSDGKMLSVARTMVSPVVEPMKTEWKYSGVVLERFLRFVASRLEQEINLTKQGSQK